MKTIVEDVAGRPIDELQDPDRPVHPYLKVKAGSSSAESHPLASHPIHSAHASGGEDPPDPIEHIYPPLIGETGRSYHGKEAEHHHETLHALASTPSAPEPGVRPHAPGPSRRPERIYLHYLLLHMDSLNDAALRYLKHAVDEEVAHREKPTAPAKPPMPAEPPAPPPVTLP